ncbi:MAG: hypothetical protein ABI411_16035 [Tahibacter sp.]
MPSTTEKRPTESRTLHFSLPKLEQAEPLTLHVCLRDYPVQVHNDKSRRAARGALPFMKHVPDEYLTHFLDVALPQDAVAMLEVTRPCVIDGCTTETTVHLGVHIPSAGVRAATRRLAAMRGKAQLGVHPKLKRFESKLLASTEAVGFDPRFPEHIETWQEATEAASTLLFTHPDLINLRTTDGGEIAAYILHACIQTALDRSGSLQVAILELGELGEDWIKTVPGFGPDGQPLVDSRGNRVFSRELHPSVRASVPGVLADAIRMAKGDEFLRGEQWTVQYGKTSADYAGEASTGKRSHSRLMASEEKSLAANPYKWALKNRTPGSGLVVDAQLDYSAAATKSTFTTSDLWMRTDARPFTEALCADLLAGKLFVQIATPQNPAGLLRAQLVPTKTPVADQAVDFVAKMSGDAVVPAVKTSATATVTCRLNDLRTSLSLSLTGTGLGTSPGGMVGAGPVGERGRELRGFAIVDDSSNGTLTLRCTNEWLRHLSACVQYQDASGNALAPVNWSEKIPSGLQGIFERDPKKKFLALVPPCRTVFGVPLPADPTVLSIPVPPDARSIEVYFGGLGNGGSYDASVCAIGTAVTVVAEMAVPFILFMAGTAVSNSKTVVDLMANKDVLFAVCAAAGFLVAGGTATYIGTSQNSTAAIKDVAITLGPMLLSPATALGQWLLKKVAEGAANRAVPFFNVFTTVVGGAVTAAQLSQTIIEVCESPWVFNAQITRALDLSVTIVPDHRYHRFPDQAVKYGVRVVYDRGATLPYQEFQLTDGPPWSDPIIVKFSDVPAGGRLKIYVFFYAANGWQAGQGESLWLDAKGTSGSTLEVKGLEIETNEVPLTKSSVYQHMSRIAYDESKGGHYWRPTRDPSTATAVTSSPHKNKQIRRLLSITTAQRPAMMAYAWQATGLHLPIDDAGKPPSDGAMYTLQNLSTLKRPDAAYAAPKIGFGLAPGIFYDVASPQDGSGRNFFIDASRGEFDPETNKAGGMHLRRLALVYEGAAPDFSVRNDKSWGRFPLALDRYLLHPQGKVIGISYRFNKLFILPLPNTASTDATAPLATMASGEGFREGLINGPKAIATGLDGRVLVLEAANHRIQAFDLDGKPVAYFADPANPKGTKLSTMALTDPGESVYRDLAVEAKGYLYVLRNRGDGGNPANYQVDLYEPDGRFLVSTSGVTADKITVDLLRNMFSLNFEAILGKGGRVEPSVSLWIPPAPAV